MSTNFALASRNSLNMFYDTATKDDVTKYTLDCSAWADDNGAITAADFSVDFGSASIANETLVDGVATVDVTMLARGKVLLSCLVQSATLKKKAFIEILVTDPKIDGDDYGQGCC